MLTRKQQHIVDVYGKPITTLDELAESVIAVVNYRVPVVGFAWDIKFSADVSCSHNAPEGEQTNFTGKEARPRNFPGFSGRFWIRYADRVDTHDWSDLHETSTHTGSGGSGSYDGLWTTISSASYKTRVRVTDETRCHGFRYDYDYPPPQCFSTDYKIFEQDWPTLDMGLPAAIAAHEKQQDQAKIFAKLKNRWYQKEKFIYTHKFKWEDPTVKAADDKFLAEYNKSVEATAALA